MPRRPTPEWLPKYRLHKRSGRAYVVIEGRSCWLGRHGTRESKAAYERVIAEWLAAGRQTPRPAPAPHVRDVTVSILVWRFRRHANETYPRKTQLVYRAALRRLRRQFGHMGAADFTPVCLRALQRSHAEERDNGAEEPRLCRQTVNDYVARVRQLFKWGAAEGLVPAAVWHGLAAVPGLRRGRGGARETRPVGPAPQAHVEAALEKLPETVADMVRVQQLTAMRPGELCAMTGECLDTTGEVWLYRPEHHKTEHHGKERNIAIGPRAQAILKKYLRRETNMSLFSPAESERRRLEALHAARKTPMTPSQRARAKVAKRRSRRRPPRESYTPDSYRRAVARACEAAKVPVWRPNQLRHTRATELRKEFGLDAAGAVLGHSRLETTQVYAERSSELAERIALATG